MNLEQGGEAKNHLSKAGKHKGEDRKVKKESLAAPG